MQTVLFELVCIQQDAVQKQGRLVLTHSLLNLRSDHSVRERETGG